MFDSVFLSVCTVVVFCVSDSTSFTTRVSEGQRQRKELSRSLVQLSVATGASSSGGARDVFAERVPRAASSAMGGFSGEADRAFRLGIGLEKNGQFRSALTAFHEAATLYQCFLDGQPEFRHVTMVGERETPSLLAYACVRLAHLSTDALGDPKAAARLYKDATIIDEQPSAVSYDGIGTSTEACGGTLERAVSAYRKALECDPTNRLVMFHLGVALDRLGQEEESEKYMDVLRRSESEFSCLVDSWGYIRWHTRKVPTESLNLHRGTRDMIELALDAAYPMVEGGDGILCEFGVGSGRSLRMTKEILPLGVPIHGFDTFQGLPQAWGREPAGAYSTGGMIPDLEGDVYFHKGLFTDTIPVFVERAPDECFLAYANIDCDLYTSTLDILEGMAPMIVPGTILVFDEYLCHSTWRQDEFRAWKLACKRFGWKYEYLAFSLTTNQAIIRVIE